MSEQGWRRFLAAQGVADWVVLHGGAMAVFRVPSLAGAARLAEAVAQISGLDGAKPSVRSRVRRAARSTWARRPWSTRPWPARLADEHLHTARSLFMGVYAHM